MAPAHPPHHPHEAPPLAALAGARPPAPDWFRAALAQAPERSRCEVQGVAIECLAWGRRGDPGLLLLHGNGAHADWWSFIAPQLAADHRVAAYSLSGMGGSDWRAAYSLAQWADELQAVAEHAGLFEAALAPLVVAHSFGSFVLMNAAARFGERLRGAVIVDAPIRPPDQAREHERRRRERGFRDAHVYPTLEAALARFRFMPLQHCEHLFIADHIARRSLKPVLDEQGRPGWSWRFDPHLFEHFELGKPYRELARARCPVTMVRGGRSRLVTPELFDYALTLAPAGSRRAEIADADHHVMVDQPLATVTLLRELLAG